jgi:hypothetical protein
MIAPQFARPGKNSKLYTPSKDTIPSLPNQPPNHRSTKLSSTPPTLQIRRLPSAHSILQIRRPPIVPSFLQIRRLLSFNPLPARDRSERRVAMQLRAPFRSTSGHARFFLFSVSRSLGGAMKLPRRHQSTPAPQRRIPQPQRPQRAECEVFFAVRAYRLPRPNPALFLMTRIPGTWFGYDFLLLGRLPSNYFGPRDGQRYRVGNPRGRSGAFQVRRPAKDQ